MVRFVILIAIASLGAMSAASAGSSGSSLFDPKGGAISKPISRSGAVTTNPCASYGANFVRVEGTDTCVKVGGALRLDMGTSTGR
ncbi:hypothetical protein; putative signal peptide [Bradyrhizobium sp. ORS 278]|uniref:porin n=1 Tax=Bradyrhizobium sp. (strain ORS 278) TaxID=114615 RepID=UPI0001508012|nr:porin [Bradyrhizobium sp. ORS 278]CAL77439.1 hypothetical protein; putative signal peptide [Bradyrhizobium sp. ORS 278]